MTEQTLANLFLEARNRLYKTILEAEGVGTKVYANSVLEQLNRELRRMRAAGNRFVDTRVPSQYQRGLDAIYAYFQSNHLRMRRPENFASIHTDAVNEIARNMQHMIDSSLVTVGRQVQRYVMKAQDEVLRQAGLRQTGVKVASGGTVSDMRAALIKELQENGFMTVQYGSGVGARQVPVDAYASMVARSTSREAGNTARLNQLTENGYDLVKITEHYPTCEVCAMHQGRVYSISGKDKRFPPLSKAFSKYNNIHPNCRHSATPWIESMRTGEEVAEAIQKSNRPWKDSRSAREVALYNSQQDKNRQARNTLYQYERYKARLGEDAPKSLKAFTRIKKAGGSEWEGLHEKYKNWLYEREFNDIIDKKGTLSNYQVRKWYKHHDQAIVSKLDPAAPLEARSRGAHALRNQYRQEARELMADREAAEKLEAENPSMSFENLLIDKMIRKNISESAAMQDIIETSGTTNRVVDRTLGLED